MCKVKIRPHFFLPASETHYVGYETFPGGHTLDGRGSFDWKVTPVPGRDAAFNITMQGYAYAIPVAVGAKAALGPMFPTPAIHYTFNGTVNFATRQASLSGSHSRYPSFSGQINGRPVFDRFQSRPPLVGLLPGLEVHDHGASDF
jgi:hypothetical protein